MKNRDRAIDVGLFVGVVVLTAALTAGGLWLIFTYLLPGMGR